MSQRFLLDEDHQLPARIMRAVIWSGTMAAFWTAPFVALIGLFTAWCYLAHVSVLSDDISYFILLSTCYAWLPMIMGTMIGLVAAFYSNSSEAFWGLRAPTFCNFFRDMILQMLVVICVCGVASSIPIKPIVTMTLIVGFLYSLWRTCARQHKSKAA